HLFPVRLGDAAVCPGTAGDRSKRELFLAFLHDRDGEPTGPPRRPGGESPTRARPCVLAPLGHARDCLDMSVQCTNTGRGPASLDRLAGDSERVRREFAPSLDVVKSRDSRNRNSTRCSWAGTYCNSAKPHISAA